MLLTFTTHHNWDWVVTEAVTQLVATTKSEEILNGKDLCNDGDNCTERASIKTSKQFSFSLIG